MPPLTSNRANLRDEHDTENQWVFAHAGTSKSGKEEFLIIHRKTGSHLTCAGDYSTRTNCKTCLSLELTWSQRARSKHS